VVGISGLRLPAGERVILHSDLNNFYASVECLYHPELRGKPVAVGGDSQARHGIVLAKNELAKSCQVKTGEPLWQAIGKCPQLVIVPPNFQRYLRFSRLARNIYQDYTDQIEPFGIDECWLDITGSIPLSARKGTAEDRAQAGEEIAQQIRQRVREEMGVTVSVGVSFNKIFAKLGSDLKKPDAVTVVSVGNFREKIWPIPVRELLYVGPSTGRKLSGLGVNTIGDLAAVDPVLLHSQLGKWGETLWSYANGYDRSPVTRQGEESVIKSIGNSTTTYRALQSEEDVRMVFCVLCESVASRMRKHGFLGRTLTISIRDDQLYTFERQMTLGQPTWSVEQMLAGCIRLFRQHWNWKHTIRSLGVRMTELCPPDAPFQMDLFTDYRKQERQESIEKTVDQLRKRFGPHCIDRAVVLQDRRLTGAKPENEHLVKPSGSFWERGTFG